MNENEINDMRKKKDFRGITFSKFKKNDAKKELLKSLFEGKLEPACYWGAEFICAGHFIDLWDIILHFMSNNIHLGNPKLPIYIELRFQTFKNIVMNGYVGQEMRLRNNIKIRQLFAEVLSILCLSKKKNSLDRHHINKSDFHMENITAKLKADNVSYASPTFRKGDPKELFIAINELAYHITIDSRNMNDACYWVEWILEFERICIAKKDKCRVERRGFVPVVSNQQMDVIWLIWEVFLNEADKKNDGTKEIILALLNLFCIRFTLGCKRKRKFLIYFAIVLLTEHVEMKTPIYTEQKIIETIKNKINIIHKQVKNNEQAPKTGYLFNNSFTDGNLEKTISKLEKMQSMNHILHRK